MIETAELSEALTERGVNPELAGALVLRLDADAVRRTIAWYDEQQGRVGAGVLVAELRAGGKRPPKQSTADEQREYADQVVDWLREHFPQWNRDDGNRTHTAAIACVIRLHHKHGKHGLSVREHGPEIRAAVREFDALLGESSR
jgi:hypothetical protein